MTKPIIPNIHTADDQSDGYKQLQRYAEDLKRVHQSEKEKRAQLEQANSQLNQHASDLNQIILKLRKSEEHLEKSYLDTIHRLVLAAEFKDEDTSEHIVRMSRYSALLAEKMGFDAKQVKLLLYAAPMHDIGKMGIPDHILMKKGNLTEEEFEIIKTHPAIGAKILAGSDSELLQAGEQIALAHHEKWDGSGYPSGLRGSSIPIFGRICALADVFDALTSRRPYKEPFPATKAFGIIQEGSGQHFDPDLTARFLENGAEILRIMDEVNPTIQTEESSLVGK